MNFILHKIFFRISILSCSETLYLDSKNTYLTTFLYQIWS